MGASRDLTTGYESGANAALLEKDVRRPGIRREATTVTPAPRSLRPGVAPHEPRKRGRLGSKQVVSVRGRRITKPTSEGKQRFSVITMIVLPLMVIGVALSMVLSGLSTQQTFTIQELQSADRALSNEVETLNRDLENLQSSAEIARRASEAGMVVPVNPGIIEVAGDGAAEEVRPADPATQPLIDVNGEPVRPNRASSDPERTDEVSGALEARPAGDQPSASQSATGEEATAEGQAAAEEAAVPAPASAPAVAPYAPNVSTQ